MVISQAPARGDGRQAVGKMVIGTVKGDIHDIGKNLVGDDDGRRRLRGDQPRDQHAGGGVPQGARRAPAGHSRHVRTADHHDALHEGRDRRAQGARAFAATYIVLVGGAPLNEEFASAKSVRMPTAATPRRPSIPRRSSSAQRSPGGVASEMGETEDSAQIRLGDRLRSVGPRAGGPQAPRRVWHHVSIHCLPAELHHRPRAKFRGRFVRHWKWAKRPLRRRLRSLCRLRNRRAHSTPCWTSTGHRAPAGRALLRALRRHASALLHSRKEELGTFYLTDFLVRHFEATGGSRRWASIGIRSSPTRLFRRTTVVSCTWPRCDSAEARCKGAQECATRLGLAFET